MDQVLTDMFKTLTKDQKPSWKDRVSKLVYTGNSTFFLMIVRNRQFLIDLLLSTTETEPSRHLPFQS